MLDMPPDRLPHPVRPRRSCDSNGARAISRWRRALIFSVIPSFFIGLFVAEAAAAFAWLLDVPRSRSWHVVTYLTVICSLAAWLGLALLFSMPARPAVKMDAPDAQSAP